MIAAYTCCFHTPSLWTRTSDLLTISYSTHGLLRQVSATIMLRTPKTTVIKLPQKISIVAGLYSMTGTANWPQLSPAITVLNNSRLALITEDVADKHSLQSWDFNGHFKRFCILLPSHVKTETPGKKALQPDKPCALSVRFPDGGPVIWRLNQDWIPEKVIWRKWKLCNSGRTSGWKGWQCDAICVCDLLCKKAHGHEYVGAEGTVYLSKVLAKWLGTCFKPYARTNTM